MVFGQEAALVGLNVVGLKRRGCSRSDLHRLRRLYQELFFGEGVIADRLERVATQFAADPLGGKIIEFIRHDTARHLTLPATRGRSDGNDD